MVKKITHVESDMLYKSKKKKNTHTYKTAPATAKPL